MKSEVARLREQISLECRASRWALDCLSSGTAQHQFISARFKRMEAHHERLTELVGEEQAARMLCEVFDQQGEGR